MHPETLLAITAAFAGFLLKTSLGFCICWALSRVVASPSGRFLIWLAFLVGAGFYWLWLASGLMPYGSALAPVTLPAGLSETAPVGKWQIQPSWAFPLSFVWRSLGVLYLFALASLLFTRTKKHMHLGWVLRFAYRAPEEIENILQPIVDSLHVGRVRLLVLPGIHSPATFGWLRPTILLPPFCLEQDRDELGIIFRHEVQHVRRRDFILHSIASLCRALLFFHPAMWYAMRQLKLESELACDLAVVGDSPDRRATYAECLLRFARLNMTEDPRPWNLDFAASSFQLKARIRSVLSETRKIPGWLLALRGAFGLLLFAGFLGLLPSLFVVLSYEQHQIAQPVNQSRFITRVNVQQHERSNRREHALNVSLPEQAPDTRQLAGSDVPANAPVEAAAAPAPQTGSKVISSDELGPTLKRRSALGNGTAQKSDQTTVIPISGQSVSYSGGPGAQGRTLNSIMTTISDVASTGHGDKDTH